METSGALPPAHVMAPFVMICLHDGGQGQLAHLAVSVLQLVPLSSLPFSSLSVRLESICIILDSRVS